MTWDSNAGSERSTGLPPFWPPQNAAVGCGVAGEIVEFGTHTIKGDLVPYVMLGNAVTREIGEDGRARMVRAGEVTINLNRGLRTALRERDTPVGTCVQIEFRGKDEKLNGMHVYRVATVAASYVVDLLRNAITVG